MLTFQPGRSNHRRVPVHPLHDGDDAVRIAVLEYAEDALVVHFGEGRLGEHALVDDAVHAEVLDDEVNEADLVGAQMGAAEKGAFTAERSGFTAVSARRGHSAARKR